VGSVSTLTDRPVGLGLTWSAATTLCGVKAPPKTPPVYDVYRSDSDFTPGPANLIAQCVTGTNYVDTNVVPGQTYWYAVRAEANGSGGTGPCNGGITDVNVVTRHGTAPAGAGSTPGNVRAFTATGWDGTVELSWANPSAGYGTTRICWRQGAFPSGPLDGSATCFDREGTAGEVDGSEHAGLTNNSWYRYGAWVNSADDGSGAWSSGRFVSARPFSTSGPVKWVYATGATTVSPAGVLPTVPSRCPMTVYSTLRWLEPVVATGLRDGPRRP
jgi:hypothetical protein